MNKAIVPLLLAACLAVVSAPVLAAEDPIDVQARNAAAVAAAIASPDRPKADRERDAVARPAEVLAFLEVGPNMRVIDMFSAGGYYTELLARTVGVKGKVIAYNNPPYAKFAEKEIAARYAGERLGNVMQITAEVGDMQPEAGSIDAALFVMSFHDAYWRPKDGGFDKTDPALMLANLFRALKPGGVVVVQDHVANPGGDTAQVVDQLHRIDPAVVRDAFQRAGFVFDGQSRVLAHPADDHTKLVFDEAIRGRTDQFIYRFRKPTP